MGELVKIRDTAKQAGQQVSQEVDRAINDLLGDRPLAIEGGSNPGNQTGKQPGGNSNSGGNQTGKQPENGGKQPQDNQNSPSSGTSVSQGRVAEPGGQPDKLKAFQDNTQVPEKYRNDPRFEELATDPDKGNKVIPASRAEAMAGLEAESQGLVPGPIKRGPSETEFYDAQGRPWDVKAPPSPKPGAPWKFDPEKSGDSIKRELSKKATPKSAPPGTFPNEVSGQPEARRVILDSTYMTEADHTALWGWLNDNLTADELDRIVEVNTQL